MSENNQKIKSITISATTYSANNWHFETQKDNYIRVYNTYQSYWFPESEVQTEYEKPKQHSNKNGSVGLPLEEGHKFSYINSVGYVVYDVWRNDRSDFYRLKTENVFLDEETAQKALDQRNKGLEVLEKLKEINREKDWVENFDGSQDNYCVKREKDYIPYIDAKDTLKTQGTFYFCKEGADYFNSLPKEDKEAFFNLKF